MVVFPVAKINLALYVTNKRDDGYHDIDTLFYPLGFSDILEVVEDKDSGPGTIGLTLSGIPVEGPEDTNLVVRAYRMLHDAVGLPGVKVYLHKCIPTGSGLGGGSSDGASMLLLLNRMFSLGLSDCELDRLALKLGSDCPFFLNPVPSFARGRGEQLVQSGVSLRGMYLLLFHPGTGISTGPAYRHVRVAPPEVALERMELMPVSQWKGVFRNVFEPYAFEKQPLIGRIREVLYESGAAFASMTGSGSAVYGLFDRDPEIAAEISPFFIRKEKL